MARNEEKQQGRLNRLWLQRERDEGRLRDVHERRPKLSSLNSAPSIRKWIPSIKTEIEYYLQQSQLSHYPERKITEFQLQIEALEKEYKSFIGKLRVLDPSCKHKPWTPRAYCKRRAAAPDGPSNVKKPRPQEGSSQRSGADGDFTSGWTGCDRSSAPGCSSARLPSNPLSETSAAVCGDQEEDQDQPLSFNPTQLAVAAAAFRGRTPQINASSQTQSLARLLHSGLPNLRSSASGQTGTRSRGTEEDDGTGMGLVTEQKVDVRVCQLQSETAERKLNSSTPEEKTAHVLGLDCYSSSDDSDHCHS